MDTPLRFGANYTPSREWMHMWLDFDADDVRRDFEALAGLGLDHVRVFPLWPIVQPNRSLIRARAIQDVRTVVDVAAEFGMDASVDVIQGHLSSFDFLPAWLTAWHDRNMFTDPEALEGQVNLVTALGDALGGAGNFLGLTLGNEVNQFSDRPHPTPMPATIEQAAGWLTTLLDAAAAAAPGQEHTHSEYDAAWYLDGHPFTPAHAARIGASTTIHSWIFNGTAQRYGGRSTASDRHAEYLIELSRAFQETPDRPIWLQEVGAPSNCLTPQEVPGFLEATVRSVARCENLWGITWWCSHDVSRDLVDFPELEYTLGLLANDNSVKPGGAMFAELAAELRDNRPAVAGRPTAIVIPVDDADTPVSRTAMSPGGSITTAWLDAIADGLDPAFVLSSRTSPEDLAARGITDLIRPEVVADADGGYSAVNTVV